MRNKYWVFRLKPNSDLHQGIVEFCVKKRIKAAAVVSAVGCVKAVCFRKADGKSIHQETRDYEVTSLTGTISEDGVHLHIQLCDNNLESCGGHLLEKTIVNTTMEIVLVNLEDKYRLTRSYDEETGYDELAVEEL